MTPFQCFHKACAQLIDTAGTDGHDKVTGGCMIHKVVFYGFKTAHIAHILPRRPLDGLSQHLA